jgi:hypothetical protein
MELHDNCTFGFFVFLKNEKLPFGVVIWKWGAQFLAHFLINFLFILELFINKFKVIIWVVLGILFPIGKKGVVIENLLKFMVFFLFFNIFADQSLEILVEILCNYCTGDYCAFVLVVFIIENQVHATRELNGEELAEEFGLLTLEKVKEEKTSCIFQTVSRKIGEKNAKNAKFKQLNH